MTSKIQGIYTILNTKNNSIYVGRSTDLEKRKKSHIDALNKNKHGNYKLQKDWNRYGEEAFQFYKQLELHDMTISRHIEKDFINLFTSRDHAIYNITDPMEEWNSIIDGRVKNRRKVGNKEEFFPLKNLLLQNHSPYLLTTIELYIYSFISKNRNLNENVLTTINLINEHLPVSMGKRKDAAISKIKEALLSMQSKNVITIFNNEKIIDQNIRANDSLEIDLNLCGKELKVEKGHTQIPFSKFNEIKNINDYQIYTVVSKWRKEPFKAEFYDWMDILLCSSKTAERRLESALEKGLIFKNQPIEKWKKTEYSTMPFVYDNLDDDLQITS